MRILPLFLAPLAAVAVASAQGPSFNVQEATFADIHGAMKAGRLTCRALVEQYLHRIDAYDKNGPAINAIIAVTPHDEPAPIAPKELA